MISGQPLASNILCRAPLRHMTEQQGVWFATGRTRFVDAYQERGVTSCDELILGMAMRRGRVSQGRSGLETIGMPWGKTAKHVAAADCPRPGRRLCRRGGAQPLSQAARSPWSFLSRPGGPSDSIGAGIVARGYGAARAPVSRSLSKRRRSSIGHESGLDAWPAGNRRMATATIVFGNGRHHVLNGRHYSFLAIQPHRGPLRRIALVVDRSAPDRGKKDHSGPRTCKGLHRMAENASGRTDPGDGRVRAA